MGCKILKVVTWPWSRPFQGWFVIGRLGHTMINPPTKFEVRSITCNGDMKCVAKCNKKPSCRRGTARFPISLPLKVSYIPQWISMWNTGNKSLGSLTRQRSATLIDDRTTHEHWNRGMVAAVEQLRDCIDAAWNNHTFLLQLFKLTQWNNVWPGSDMVRASDSRLERCGFNSPPFPFHVTA